MTLKAVGLRNIRAFSLNFRKAPPLIRPIFIVGTVRSATTLISRYLGNHPNVCHPAHRHFELSPEWTDLAGIDIGVPSTKRQHCPPLTTEDVTEEMRQAVRDGFAKIHVETGGGQSARFLMKNPHFWNKLPFLHAIFPEMSLLVTSRDIVSTAVSTKRIFTNLETKFGVKHYLPLDPQHCWQCINSHSCDNLDPLRTFPGGDIAVIAEYWLRAYKTIEENIHGFQVVFLIKHRDFIKNPQLMMTRIHEALDLPMAEYALPAPIDPSRNEHWRSALAAQEKKSIKSFIDDNYDAITSLKYADTTIVDV